MRENTENHKMLGHKVGGGGAAEFNLSDDSGLSWQEGGQLVSSFPIEAFSTSSQSLLPFQGTCPRRSRLGSPVTSLRFHPSALGLSPPLLSFPGLPFSFHQSRRAFFSPGKELDSPRSI